MTFEIISRTAKTATIAIIQHAGRFNEKITDTKEGKSTTGNAKKL